MSLPVAAAPEPEALLTEGLGALGLDTALGGPLTRYLDRLLAWRRVDNIIGDREPGRLVWRHILESLCAHRYVEGRCLDLGSGAGLPGLPLALARPETDWILLDSRLKCCRFLRHVLNDLAPPNAAVCHVRAERYRPEALFDRIICRALASLPDVHRLAGPLLAPTGRLLVFKGPAGTEVDGEMEALRRAGVHARYHDIHVPGGRHCGLVECGPVGLCHNDGT